MKPIELALGATFGRLTVIRFHSAGKQGRVYLCKCSCGNEIPLPAKRWGKTQSCRCLNRERLLSWTRNPNRKHGMSQSPEYRSWGSMRERCSSQLPRFKNWSGRGIKVCDEWEGSFEKFYTDMGARPDGRTLDRIDVNGNYEPGNCRWATPLEQSKNRRNYTGVTRCKKICNFSDDELLAEVSRRGLTPLSIAPLT